MKFTEVDCSLRDCVFYQKHPQKPYLALCKHPDVLMHKTKKKCSLYKMDWEKKMDAVSDIAKKIKG